MHASVNFSQTDMIIVLLKTPSGMSSQMANKAMISINVGVGCLLVLYGSIVDSYNTKIVLLVIVLNLWTNEICLPKAGTMHPTAKYTGITFYVPVRKTNLK